MSMLSILAGRAIRPVIWKSSPARTDDQEDIPIPVFTALVKGAGPVHLHVNGVPAPAF